DPDGQRQLRTCARLIGKGVLELDRAAKRLAGRVEDGQDLVAAQLDKLAIPRLDGLLRDLREGYREPRCGLVTVLGRKAGVAADVPDEERPDRGRAPRFSWHSHDQAIPRISERSSSRGVPC